MKKMKLRVWYKDGYKKEALLMDELLRKNRVSHSYIGGLIVIEEEMEFQGITNVGVFVKIKDKNYMFTKEYLDMNELYLS
jgi:hypothetical protein